MKQEHPQVSLERLCGLFGKTRQAYYQLLHRNELTTITHSLVLILVKEIREDMPFIGTRKLLHLLTPKLQEHNIKMGRDQLFDLLRFHGLLVRRRQRKVYTTNSHHWLKKYPNLIKEIILTGSEQLWVSDITYVRTFQGFNYLSLIMDAYSKKIMGFTLDTTLEADGPIKALKMAISNRSYHSSFFLIHHSDRGVQYCSSRYVELLVNENIAISMTEDSNPCDNSMAERVNGIVKNEFKKDQIYRNHKEAYKAITKDILVYNTKRPHGSIDYHTPEVAHYLKEPLKKRWKNYRKSRITSPLIHESNPS